MRTTIEISGARENNLKNVSVEIPRDKLVVVTGVSGSGKSSLAFDVLFGEGQRRFMESLSAYARSRIPMVKRPDVDYVKGLSPVLSISQTQGIRNPRSTVGTLTETHSYLRLLYSSVSVPHCPYCDKEVSSRTPHQIADRIQSLPFGTQIEILAPVFKIYGENYDFLFDEIRNAGCRDIWINGELLSISDKFELDEDEAYNIEAVVDRFVINGDQSKQIVHALIECQVIGEGFVHVNIIDPDKNEIDVTSFYSDIACPEHHIHAGELLPWFFSSNESDASCRTCGGLGTYMRTDPFLLVIDPDKSISEGAIEKFALNMETLTFKRMINWHYVRVYSMAQHYGFSLDTPVKDLSDEIKDIIFNGTRGKKFELIRPPDETRDHSNFGRMIVDHGLLNRIDRWYKRSSKRRSPKDYEERIAQKLMVEKACPDCNGTKLRATRMLMRINGKNIFEIGEQSIREMRLFMDCVKVAEEKSHIAGPIITEVKKRLDLMIEIGLDYLSLNRRADTLSGGELQRTRLTTQIGSELMGMLVVLDEPSIGLHAKDSMKVVDTLKKLRDIGNSIIVVEHDVDTMRSADHIIEMGPGPGVHGGKIVAEGRIDVIEKTENSITGQYLSGRRTIPVPETRRKSNGQKVRILGARANNLKDVDVEIPLGVFVCATGVSGSGKSSLVDEILHKKLQSIFRDRRILPGPHKSVEGIEYLKDVRNIDQSAIGRSSRSNPATYVGVFDKIRRIFADLPESEERGFSFSDFTYNQTGERCPDCKGEGVVRTELQFMPDVESICPACKGTRFTQEIQEVKYKGKSISEVLDMTVEEAMTFFEDVNLITHKLKTMHELGLGYLKLGQPSNQLSGGEAQRVKLARELGKIKSVKGNLYILDEPTTGLHLADIQKLLDCLNRLVDAGNTVLVIEHHLDVIKNADYVIDLGPGGGEDGGLIVAAGTPEEIMQVEGSHTGRYLTQVIGER
ncbi:MAG: excinuclease ABC subunit UvrA [Candidatus Thorarchaeota archaeon]|jgi:excinuclease ABC subunit A